MSSNKQPRFDAATRRLFDEISDGSDRVCAILSAAYLEDRMRTAIEQCLLDDKDSTNKLFKPSGPLGSLASKAEMAYLLKLCTKSQRDDILLIAQIRNNFAHWAKPVEFGSHGIKEHILKLSGFLKLLDAQELEEEGINLDGNIGLRNRWTMTTGMAASYFDLMTDHAKPLPDLTSEIWGKA